MGTCVQQQHVAVVVAHSICGTYMYTPVSRIPQDHCPSGRLCQNQQFSRKEYAKLELVRSVQLPVCTTTGIRTYMAVYRVLHVVHVFTGVDCFSHPWST